MAKVLKKIILFSSLTAFASACVAWYIISKEVNRTLDFSDEDMSFQIPKEKEKKTCAIDKIKEAIKKGEKVYSSCEKDDPMSSSLEIPVNQINCGDTSNRRLSSYRKYRSLLG